MTETQENTINACRDLLQRLINIENVNNVDELRLVLIKNKILEAGKLIDDFGKKMYEGLSK